ncbi:MAG: potassium channel protein [Deltaproteobacteria bacterium]|nr:potassium channel protein [Deltaproteobacteria bacterium]
MDTSTRRLISAILFLVLALIAGLLGYQIIEGWNFSDSLYMTVITLATVGYGETNPLTPTGRVFTMFLIMVGVGALTYGLTAATAFVVEGTLTDMIGRRRMEAEINKLKDHIILCGIGEIGRHIVREFLKTQIPFIVIEKDEERLKQMGKIGGFLYIEGDATDDHVLLRARIGEARGLVTALPQDRDNVFVILTARGLNPNLRIVSRVVEEESRVKLVKAGADDTVSTNFIGGLRMASVMIRPTVVSFLDKMLRAGGDDVRVAEAKVPPDSAIVGRSLGEAGIYKETGLIVIGIARGESYELNPGPDTRLLGGDGLIVCCSVEQLKKLNDLVAA